MLRYKCDDCDSIITAKRKRKKCPNCKGTSLVAYTQSINLVTQQRANGPVRASGVNLFTDDLTEFKDEIKVGKKIYKKERVPRVRKSTVSKITCSRCGGKEQVDTSYIQNIKSFICTGCITGMR